MVGKPSICQMHNLLLEFYFRILCTSNARNLLLLILFFPIDISHNKIVLFFFSVCVISRLFCHCMQSNKFDISQNGANWGDVFSFHNLSPPCNEPRMLL